MEKISPASLGEISSQAKAKDVGVSTDFSSASITSQSREEVTGNVVATTICERVGSPCAAIARMQFETIGGYNTTIHQNSLLSNFIPR